MHLINFINNNRSLKMINHLKLKLRTTKEDPAPSRRIKTDVCENNKKISFYTNKSKVPLADNKKILNQSQTLTLKNTNPYKCINLKPPSTKLNTQVRDVDKLTNVHRQAIDKIFGPTKKTNAIAVVSHSMKREKQDKQPRKVQTVTGAARYILDGEVGSGTFGVVHVARDKLTLEKVAIKRVFQDKKYKNRQLQILKILNHPNVLKMKNSFYTYDADKQYLNVVMDYYPCNLYESLQKYRGKAQISRLKLKAFAYQMFRGLLYLNSINIAHRDMKPQNILVNDQTWNLIICDFGSAKRLQPGQPNLSYICSRCYRAPQLIFGSTNYTTQIDIWSVGCILVQMITLEPIFRSGSNIDQLVQIIKILGSPSYEQIMEMNPDCDIKKYQFPKIQPRSWQKVLKRKNIGQQFYDLLNGVLKYSPKKRTTPYQALLHPFFDELRDQQLYKKLKKQCSIMDLFDFQSSGEMSQCQISNLIPYWYVKQ